MRKIGTKAAALALTLSVASMVAIAGPVVATADAVWVNPLPSGTSPYVTTGVGTSAFTWGNGAPPNSLNFVGASISSNTETAFKVGTITYYNGTTALGTNPDSIELALTLDFTDPSIGLITSDYTFDLVTTPNSSDPVASADYVYFPTAFSSTSFLIGGVSYNVALTGFQNVSTGGGFLDSSSTQFHVEEGQTASADLFAIVTTRTSTVPEPQTLALVLAAFAALGMAHRQSSPKA